MAEIPNPKSQPRPDRPAPCYDEADQPGVAEWTREARRPVAREHGTRDRPEADGSLRLIDWIECRGGRGSETKPSKRRVFILARI